MKNKTIAQHDKRIILGLITTILFMFLCIGPATHAQAKTYKISSASSFHKIGSYKGGTFKLTKDIKLTKPSQYLTISKNKTYVIDLNGHKIKANSYNSGKIRDYVPIILKKGTLKIKNSAKKKGYLLSTEGAAVFVTGGKLYTYGAGTKTYPSFKGTYGNGLYILARSGAKVTLKGGSFISNTSNLSGYYPILDYYGNTITLPKGYSFRDSSGKKRPITNFGYAKYVASNYNTVKKWQWITVKK